MHLKPFLPTLAAWLLALAGQASAEVPVFQALLLQEFATRDARQGVAADAGHFYAINNTRIAKHDKFSGELVLEWDGGPEGIGPLIHLDSAMVLNGKLYAAHSNYPHWPMTSSVEIWDAASLEHLGSHSFGVRLGSLTWLDRQGGYWWATFANYDKVQDGQTGPYGSTAATTLVKLDDDFEILQQWRFPPELLERFRPMSNSGGSWGPDGHLYITGHDYPEIYVVRAPDRGAEVEWLATVKAPQIEGQGIAWDRSEPGRVLWGILKAEERVFRFEMPVIGELE